jgi:acetoin utilization deacetylase AcuC-like enzyme
MFRIRRVADDVQSVDRQAILQVQAILREQFAGVPAADIDGLPAKLRDPFAQRFQTLLLVAEARDGAIQGCAVLLHEPRLHLVYLDYLAAGARLTSRGIGGALYQRVREEALALGARSVYFECLPDDPEPGLQPADLAANRARLRFYEYFGARPLAGTLYNLPYAPDAGVMPLLVHDGLDRAQPLRRRDARAAVRAILERKYAHLCPPAYVRKVVNSIQDDPVRLREPRYRKKVGGDRAVNAAQTGAPGATVPAGQPSAPGQPAQPGQPVPAGRPVPTLASRELIALCVNDRHDIHHVHDRGYVEAPVRVRHILAELEKSGLCEQIKPRARALDAIREVHDAAFVSYLRRTCLGLPADRAVYPYVFPARNPARPPADLALRAGYYCIDTFTPLSRNAFLAARRAVDCTLAAAAEIRRGRRLAYALVRPPGHHAERRLFGGFCYFNNAAIAAHDLLRLGRVAILDIDYHHGNGQQDIFYARPDVLTISIHGHPRFAYPYFTGFADELGEGAGRGYNLNLPLPEQTTCDRYRETLDQALRRVRSFAPAALVVCLGLDTAKGDPTGTWTLQGADFHENGRRIGAVGLPTLVVQEGGYRTRTLGTNARQFLGGLVKGAFGS